jgi:hypothetical protein
VAEEAAVAVEGTELKSFLQAPRDLPPRLPAHQANEIRSPARSRPAVEFRDAERAGVRGLLPGAGASTRCPATPLGRNLVWSGPPCTWAVKARVVLDESPRPAVESSRGPEHRHEVGT